MRLESGCFGVVENSEGVGADGLVFVRARGSLWPLRSLHGARHTRTPRAVSPVPTHHAVTPRSSSASFIERSA
ncbi:hypothetical protein SGLAM104S_06727 [Streptomyces glaucescens]